MKKNLLLITIAFLLSVPAIAQSTYVPDDKFEQALINLGLDSGALNDSVPTSAIDTLSVLTLSSKKITDLTGIADFSALTTLNCYNNQITDIDISANTNMKYFNIGRNQLTSIDIRKNTALISFSFGQNQISNIDLSKNTILMYLSCNSNNLTTLDISGNPNLKQVSCCRNQLISVDFSHNANLTSIYIYENNLTELNLKNGNNAILNLMSAHTNPDLTCIDVDDVNVAESKTNWAKDISANYSENCGNFVIPMTYVPDDNFEQAIINLGWDSGELNDSVPTAAIRNQTSLDVRSKNISDLTGIEDFAALQSLICYGNQLSALDVSKNVFLQYLSCSGNNITSLDVSSNVNLESLRLNQNQITDINLENNPKLRELYIADNPVLSLNLQNKPLLELLHCDETNITELDVSTNTALKDLTCTKNGLSSLDISKNIALEILACSNNELTSLDLSKNTLLKNIYCDNNQISTLDASTCVALEILQITSNQLTSLNLEACPVLKTLCCYNNQIISLDLSTNSALTLLLCQSNNLTELNINNNNNSSITKFNAKYNNDLLCIQVDDSLAAIEYENWEIDGVSKYANNCGSYKVEMTYVPDNNFEQAIIDLGYDSGSLNDSVPTQKINKLTYFSIGNKNISKLTGIEDFKALTKLVCSGNPITTINLGTNTFLEELYCGDCQLTELNLNANTALTKLSCSKNQLTELNVAANTLLEWLDVQQNQITAIDLSTNTALKYFSCYQNNLTELDLNNNTLMEELYCGKNQLKELPGILNFSQNQKSTLIDENSSLNKLQLSQNNFVFASLEDDWSQLNQLEYFDYTPQAKIGTITDTSVVRNKPFTFSIENYIPGSNDQYQWYKGNQTIEGATNLTLELDSADYTDAGTYTCEITSTLISSLTLYSELIKLTVSTPVGINEIPKLDINIYPNPATTKIYVEAGNNEVGVQIFDQMGKQVLAKSNFTSGQINVSQLPKGMYFAKITHQQKVATKKIILR